MTTTKQQPITKQHWQDIAIELIIIRAKHPITRWNSLTITMQHKLIIEETRKYYEESGFHLVYDSINDFPSKIENISSKNTPSQVVEGQSHIDVAERVIGKIK